MSTLVELDNVSLRYGEADGTLALSGVDLSIPGGAFVAVVGVSGCGKSSLLRLIAGLRKPSSGEVRVHGAPLKRPLGNVGMAFQNASLLPWRRTLGNVLLPLEVARNTRRAYRQDPGPFVDKARTLLETVGLGGFEGRYPRELSGGMKQRVSLCRALIHEPELLLLDEPFGALDAFTKEELWGVLQRLRETTGCTVVLISHDLTEATYLADTVYVMSARPGRIVARAEVPFAQPRVLELRFTPRFTDIVALLRHHIGQTRPLGAAA